MKRFIVHTLDGPIGSSDLEGRDDGMGVANGAFFATPSYGPVRALFVAWSEAREAKPVDESSVREAARRISELGLTLHTVDGAHVPTSSIAITDYSLELGEDAREVMVIVADRASWIRFFSRPASP